MAKLVFDPNGFCEHAIDIAEEGVPFPDGSTSQQEFRYILVDGKAVDRFAGLDDDAALAAFDKLVQDRNAAAETAGGNRLRAEKARLSRLEYLRRFTQAERIAIRGSTDPVIADFMSMVDAAEFIDLLDEELTAGTEYLVTKKLLTASRAAEILAV